MAVIDRQHAHTVRLEAQAHEKGAEHQIGLDDGRHDAVLHALLAISYRLELIETELRHVAAVGEAKLG
jgi:hypothetical protein